MPEAKAVIWAPRAERDLREIWSYYANAASSEIADTLLRDISEAIGRLNQRPAPGRTRDEIRAGLRSVRTRGHSVFFRIGQTKIEIVRVLHDSRDLPKAIGKT